MHKSSSDHDHALIRLVDTWSNRLMIVVVIIPFIVSFGALKDLATANGVNYPFMYPLMIDLSLIIFNLIALRSSLHGERNWYAWLLVITATIISVVLNIVHAPQTTLAMFMAALPPLFILAAFHLVVLRIERSVKHNQVVVNLETVQAMIATNQAENEQLISQNESLTREIEAKTKQLGSLNEQIEKAQMELNRLQHEQLSQQERLTASHDPITVRHEQLQALLDDSTVNMTQSELADALGVSLSTVRRDLQILNGKVS